MPLFLEVKHDGLYSWNSEHTMPHSRRPKKQTKQLVRMIELKHPDTLHLQAAVGWLELGNHLEANEELAKITASLRAHPDVLMVRWLIFAKGEQWEGAFEIARALVEMVPEFPTGWIYQAEALRRMPNQEVKGAWAALLPAADKFPRESAILYNLALLLLSHGKNRRRLGLAGNGVQSGKPGAVQIKGA